MSNSQYFMQKCKEIEDEYERLHKKHGNGKGWTFLMSSKETLSPATEIAFISLNPGGDECEEPVPSYEGGSAYLVDIWSKKGPGESPLQKQIQKLFKEIYKRLKNKIPYKTYEDLMHDTLSSQYILFRSKNEKTLPWIKESEEFSNKLWKDVFHNQINPRIVITLSNTTFGAIFEIMKDSDLGYTSLSDVKELCTGRKASSPGSFINARIAVFKNPDNEICTLVGLPHLSTYRIFTSGIERIQNGTKKILDKMVENF